MPPADPTPPATANPKPGPSPPLLPLYIHLNYNLRALADHTGLDHLTLLDWLTHPDTRAKLKRLREAAEQSLTLRALEARRSAIDALEDVLNTTDDPIEKRRAATALLRALNNRPRAVPSDSDLHPSKPQASKPPLPPNPIPLLDHLLATRTDDDPDPHTLHAACHPDATINDEPIPPDPDDLYEDIDDDAADFLANTVQVTAHADAAEHDVVARKAILIRRGGAARAATFHLSPDADAVWRIHAIDIVEPQPRRMTEPLPPPRPRPPRTAPRDRPP